MSAGITDGPQATAPVPRGGRARSPAAEPRSAEHRLLAAARSGDLTAAAGVCDRHGAALLALARTVLGECATAESAVADAITTACTDRDSTDAARSLRHELARLTYQRCGTGARPPQSLSAQQGASLALVLFGDHSYRDAAELMQLPVPTLAGLLRSGLDARRQHDATPKQAN